MSMSKTRRLRETLSYANVVSTLCLFLLLGGGMAFAASHLGKNSVGSKQLKKSSVSTAKIKANAVTGAKVKDGSLAGVDIQDGSLGGAKLQDNSVTASKLADNSVSGAKVQDGSLTSADFNPSTFASLKANNVIGIGFNGNSTCSAATPLPAGVSSERLGGPGSGECKITFPGSVVDCAATATPRFRNANLVIVEQRTAEVLQFSGSPNSLEVDTYGGGSTTDQPFDLVVVC